MSGIIYYGPGSQLGSINSNTEEGIFGKVNERFKQGISQDAIPIGYRQDVKREKLMCEVMYLEKSGIMK